MVHSTDFAPWTLIAAAGAATSIGTACTGLSFDGASAGPPLVACLLLVALAALYRGLRPDPRLATTLMCCAQLVAFTACAAPLSYVAASAGRPLWDDALLSWDRALGLDWRSYLAFVNAHPWLGTVCGLAYRSLMPQFVVATAALGFSGRLTACRTFVLAVIVAGLVSIVVSAFMPAMGMFVRLWLHPNEYPNLSPGAVSGYVAHMTGLRDGTLKVISLRSAEGIITFPSFHAALGVILSWAFWRVPWTRWPGLALNVVLIAATPIDGGHYFADVVAGALVAGVAIRAALALDRRAWRGHSILVAAPRESREAVAYDSAI